jgi:hypothetical protein
MLASAVLFVLIETIVQSVNQERTGAIMCLLLATVSYGVVTAVGKIVHISAG